MILHKNKINSKYLSIVFLINKIILLYLDIIFYVCTNIVVR